MIKKIVNIGGEEFSEYEIKEVERLEADFFVYRYESGCYDGSGFAIWKKGKKWFYDYLGHCSCNRPTDGLSTANNAEHTFTQIKEIVKTSNKEYQDLVDYIIKNK